MGSPPVDGGRHRKHEPAIGEPRTIMFSTRLPDRDIDQLTVRIPAPRAPMDAPTEKIRHVVVSPEATYWDSDVVQDEGHAPARGGRWGVALGALVVTGCAAYIAVVGIGGLRGGTPAPAATALTGAEVTATFPASAVVPEAAEAAVPTSLVAILRRTATPRPVAPVTTRAVTPAAATAAPTQAATQEEQPVQDAESKDGTPRLADPPPAQAATPAPEAGPKAQTAPVATPPNQSKH